MGKPSILVVGAGLGGLTAALALTRKGFDVSVVEQAIALGEVGAGLQLSANAMRVLHGLGLAHALSGVAAEPTGKEIRLWSTGQRWNLFDLGAVSVQRYGFPYCMFHRADLHAVLAHALDGMAPGCVQLGARCTGLDLGGDRPAALLADGRRLQADVVVGADGVHSAVRAALVGPDRPRFSGCVAWRGVIAAPRLPAHLRAPVGVNWVGPGRHVIHYPLRRGELINFVGIVEKGVWPSESWTQQGTLDDCLSDFSAWHNDVHTLIRNVDRHYQWALMVREPLERWSFGGCTLLGDAAHPTLPFLAQGAAMAIEDACVLARCLETWSDDPVRALAVYQDTRSGRTARIVRGSTENATRFHNPQLADASGAAAYVSEQWAPERVQARYGWLFEYCADETPLQIR